MLLYGAAFVVVLGSIANTSSAQIYVANRNLNTVSEFSLSGALINPALVSDPNYGYDVAVAGNNLFFTTSGGSSTLGEFNATTGATVIPSMVSGLQIGGVAVSGNSLYASSAHTPLPDGTVTQSIAVFNASTGALVNNALITGLNGPTSVAVSGNNLYELNYHDGSIGKYDATTGAVINASLVGLSDPAPQFIAVSGNDLFVSDSTQDRVLEYDATTGTLLNQNFITGLFGAYGLAVVGGDLFVVSDGIYEHSVLIAGATIGEYDATTGVAINATLIYEPNPNPGTAGFIGLSDPRGIAVVEPVSSSSVPDTAGTLGLLGLSMGGLVLLRRQLFNKGFWI